MAFTVLIEATPLAGVGTNQVAVRLAGGGSRAYTHKGFTDWRAGVATRPRFTTALGFDDTGWNGGAVPQAASVTFGSTDRALLTQLAGLYWRGARIVVSVGDDSVPNPAWTIALVGTVVDAPKLTGAILSFTITDLSGDLGKKVVPNTFAGTGDLEGVASAAGRIKRRTWGYVFNVEGLLLDSAYNIYEFGDPAQPLQDFPLVKDKGYPASSTVTVAWQGTAAATLTALRNASAPSGGAAIAPSIACVKWWTQPSGPLTADIKGENANGYIDNPGLIAAQLLALFAPAVVMGNASDAQNLRPYMVGVHCDDASETVQNVFDRLFLPISLAWVMDPSGLLYVREWKWTGSTEAITADTITRENVFNPLLTRKLGYQKNHRIHSDSEISAAITSTDVTYVDGTPIETLKPAQAGADVTGAHVSQAIIGQGPWATESTPVATITTPGTNLMPYGRPVAGSSAQAIGWNGPAAPGSGIADGFVLGVNDYAPFGGLCYYLARSSGSAGSNYALFDIQIPADANAYTISLFQRALGGSVSSFVQLLNSARSAVIKSATFAQIGTAANGVARYAATIPNGVGSDGAYGAWIRLIVQGTWPASSGTPQDTYWYGVKAEQGYTATPYGDGSRGAISSTSMLYSGSVTGEALRPAQVGADPTSAHVAAGFVGQGGLAVRDNVGTPQIIAASATDMVIVSNTNRYNGSGGAGSGSASGGSGGTVSKGGSGGTGGGGASSGGQVP